MIESVLVIWNLLWGGVVDFLHTPFALVQYRRASSALIVGGALIGLFFLRILFSVWLEKKNARGYSGQQIPGAYRRGIFAKISYATPKVMIALGVCFLLMGFANPYLVDDNEFVREIESQIRIDLVDVSTSMWESFPGSEKSKAQVAREAHLEFLEMRKEKSDMVSFWLFSSNAYMEVDFTTDYNQYFLQVYGAPYILYSGRNPSLNVPLEKVAFVGGEGGTDLQTALESIIKQYDNDPRIQNVANEGVHDIQKALLITTDAEVNTQPKKELEQLRERNIVPIILFINDNVDGVDQSGMVVSPRLPNLVLNIEAFGGKYFDVSGEDSLRQAYEEIDKMGKMGFRINSRVSQIYIYQRFVVVGFLIICSGLIIGVVIEPLLGIYP